MSSFHALVRLDENGDTTCFCSYESYLKGECECRGRYDCPEAVMEITVLPNSRPSDKSMGEVKKASRDLKQVERKMKKASDRIKQGVSQLEKATKGNRWRI